MNKNTKKILALSVLGLFMFVFVMSFVLAAPTDVFKSFFSQWGKGELNPGIIKYLFWALVSMAVYSVGSKIPVINQLFTKGKEWLGMIFSVVVGFLSMAYITPAEVYAMMASYSALGFVLGGALPFLILLAFTFTLATDTTGSAGEKLGRKTIAWVMWAAFVIFLIYRIFTGMGNDSIEVSAGISLLQWAILIIAILILISLGAVFKKFGGLATKSQIEEYHEKTKKQVGKLKADVEALEEAATSP